MTQKNGLPVRVFSTAPQSANLSQEEYVKRLIKVAQWSEGAGCTGMLIYTDNRLVDPWLVAQVVLQNTERLCPLVAVQPIYMHPYSVAKMVTSLAYLHGRRIYLNMVAGGFRNDLLALADGTPHDQRYERMLEYTQIIKGLLRGGQPFTFQGKFYQLKDVVLKPHLPPELFPGIFLSGSSEAGMATARALDATAVEYPRPGHEYSQAQPRENSGIRIGIIADEQKEKAWQIAYERFPEDRRGQIAHMLAMKVSDSKWHKQLSDLDRELHGMESIYWLWPFKNYNTFCPYLVGSYEEVSDELAKYMRAGFSNYILDIPAEEWDLCCTGIVFYKAAQKAGLESAVER